MASSDGGWGTRGQVPSLGISWPGPARNMGLFQNDGYNEGREYQHLTVNCGARIFPSLWNQCRKLDTAQ